MRYLTGLVILIAASMACSRGDDRPVADSLTSPTAASGFSTISAGGGGVSRPMVVNFPPRNESMLFRNELESKYVNSLRRTPAATFVDPEGEVVWMQEYLRYRTNGCDHATAIARVLAQIDGGAPGPVCSDVDPNAQVAFPGRNDLLEARRALETKYQQMGRTPSFTAVDAEGASIWIAEYQRYRASGCDHATAMQKVFAQIDGGAVPASCFVPPVPCSYILNPGGIHTGAGGSTQSFEVRPPTATTPTCAWTLASTVPWLTVAAGFNNGAGFTIVPYTVAQNHGSERTGHIDIAWQGGGSRYTVSQDGTPFAASFTMVDPFQSSGPTTECHFRSASTPCNFTATANLPGGGAYTYQWLATYFYGTQKTISQFNNSNTFSFTDQCGGTDSTATGTLTGLNVTVVITDSLGNSITLRSGEGNQPALGVRLFSC
jgi:hypothetical protein